MKCSNYPFLLRTPSLLQNNERTFFFLVGEGVFNFLLKCSFFQQSVFFWSAHTKRVETIHHGCLTHIVCWVECYCECQGLLNANTSRSDAMRRCSNTNVCKPMTGGGADKSCIRMDSKQTRAHFHPVYAYKQHQQLKFTKHRPDL